MVATSSYLPPVTRVRSGETPATPGAARAACGDLQVPEKPQHMAPGTLPEAAIAHARLQLQTLVPQWRTALYDDGIGGPDAASVGRELAAVGRYLLPMTHLALAPAGAAHSDPPQRHFDRQLGPMACRERTVTWQPQYTLSTALMEQSRTCGAAFLALADVITQSLDVPGSIARETAAVQTGVADVVIQQTRLWGLWRSDVHASVPVWKNAAASDVFEQRVREAEQAILALATLAARINTDGSPITHVAQTRERILNL